MKKLVLLAALMLSIQFGLNAQTVTFNNTRSDYFIGALHSTTTGSSCASIVPNNFYYDIPNNYVYSTYGVWDEYGTTVTIPSIIGISFQIYPGGAIFSCSFCSPGASSSGVKTVVSGGTAVTVVWQFVGADLTIYFI